MKKIVVMCISLFAAVAIWNVQDSAAHGTYGTEVNAYCLDSDPYKGDCLFCHTSNYKDPSTEKDAYSSGDLCFFCPNDSACSGPLCVDIDQDGYYSEAGCGTAVDCNDNDATINPAAAEDCFDSIDNNCDGYIDQQDPACGTVVCTDNDGDGYSVEGGGCGPVDCNDGDPDIYPGADDVCNDGIDQDCSGKDRTKGKACSTSTSTRVHKEGKGRTCSDGIDNDGDQLVDCDDSDCSTNRACIGL